jgi:ribonuclease HI
VTHAHLKIHTDGGARGNPGPAAIGVVIESGDQLVREVSATIGSTTNNQAEYQAVYAALIAAQELGAQQVDVYADSELIVKQLRGEYKVKNKELGPWFVKIQALIKQVGLVRLHVIRREDNVRADALVNQALDDQLKTA